MSESHKGESSPAEDGCVILFVRFPEKGRVKTRLAASVGDETAVRLYENFVLDAIDTLSGCPRPFIISFHPPSSAGRVASWLGDHRYMPQRGADLGERMKNAFLSVFETGVSKALLMGSDVPDLPPSVIEEAFSALGGNGAVLGPALDGGYYLIGFNKNAFVPGAFEGIAWGAPSVFRDTMRALEGVRVHVLPRWRDVDTVEDLDALFLRRKNRHEVRL
jgi:hypothetical protein